MSKRHIGWLILLLHALWFLSILVYAYWTEPCGECNGDDGGTTFPIVWAVGEGVFGLLTLVAVAWISGRRKAATEGRS